MHLRLFSLLRLWCAAIPIYADSVPPSEPPATSSNTSMITATNFQGLYSDPNGAIETVACGSDYFWGTVSTYGTCCPNNGDCDICTECNFGTCTGMAGNLQTCESDAPQCGTMTVFAYPAASNSWINQFCANSWSENTVYRILPATTSSSSSLPPTALTTQSSSQTASPISTATAGPPPTSLPINNSVGGSSSKAWIAGAVTGPVAVVAATVILGIWFNRRMRKPAARDSFLPTGKVGYVQSMPPASSANANPGA